MLRKTMLWILAGYTSIRLGTTAAVVLMGATTLPVFVVALSAIVSVYSATVVVKTFSRNTTTRTIQFTYAANIFAVLVNMLFVKMFYPATIEMYEYLVVGTFLEVVVFSVLLLMSLRQEKLILEKKQMLAHN